MTTVILAIVIELYRKTQWRRNLRLCHACGSNWHSRCFSRETNDPDGERDRGVSTKTE